MYSRTAEYALRAVVWLSMNRDKAHTTGEIAEATGVPPSYLSKVLQTLGRARLVHSQRGLGGGFTLAVLSGRLTVLEVINAVDPLPRIRSCPLELEAHSKNLCRLHRQLDEAVRTIESLFAGVTIESLYSDDVAGNPMGLSVRGLSVRGLSPDAKPSGG